MDRKFLSLILPALLLCLIGCSKKMAAPVSLQNNFMTVSAHAGNRLEPGRYIAESHSLEIITSESDLQKAWDSAVAFCATIQCEVLSSNITRRSADSAPTGAISLRVAPEDLNKLLAHAEKLGKIAQHTTQREDKTVDVTDTDAKIKNLTSFRDNLRAMLSKPSATVKDLIDIQQQLTETQSQLDSETAQRKILANQTEKTAVQLAFRVNHPTSPSGGFAQIRTSLRQSGSTLAESTAYLIDFIFTVVPWLVLILPALWLLRKAWRKFRPKRPTSLSPPQPSN